MDASLKKAWRTEIYLSLTVAEIEALVQPEDAPPTEADRQAKVSAKAKLRLALKARERLS